MSIKYYNTAPYYDDFDKTKNYLRVLFRPGFAVQARELTQLQTAIQAQIDRFGSHIFKDGTQVLGGQINLNTEYAYVKLASSITVGGTAYNADDQAPLSVGCTITGAVTGITATVLEVTASTETDPTTLFVRYTSADSTLGIYHVFGASEKLSFSPLVGGTRYFQVGIANDVPVGFGTRLSVTEGVFFISGCFVYSPAVSVIMAKYSNGPSGRLVFAINESLITQAEDLSLTDNAIGTPNEAAPGAHRYAISLDPIVQSIELTDRSESGIIQLAVVKNGKLVAQAHTEYSVLADTLAQRTFEESGNYTVRPFQINIREYFNNGVNGGLYTAAQIRNIESTITTDLAAETFGKARLAVGLEPAVAYVNGYRIELTDTRYIPVEKARDEGYINAASSVLTLGNYVKVVLTGTCGLPDITNFSTLTLRTAQGTGGISIGTARARSIEKDYDSGSNIYRLYLFDVQMDSGRDFSQVGHILQTGTPGFDALVSGTATLADIGNNTLIYQLPSEAIQSLRTQDGLIDTLYYVRNKYDDRRTDATTGDVTISANSDEIFESTIINEWIAVKSDKTFVTPNTITISPNGLSITLRFTSAKDTAMYIVGPSRRNLREKIKQYITNYTVTLPSPNIIPGSYDSLGICDLFKIDGIYMTADLSTAPIYANISTYTNITDRYTVDNGQRDNFYDVARIQLKAGAVIPVGQIMVVLSYFSHQPGDYFTVDSYTGIDYVDIPSFQSSKGLIQLRDAVDFRPRKNTAGNNFTGTGASVGVMIKPNSIFTSDIQYYLPRTDKIYVDKLGNFGNVKGVSKSIPLTPEDPRDAMVLYVLKLGAYTFGAEHVVPIMLDNRRYTMRDIGKIEKRLSNVEYYTALSLLEKDTAGLQIFDGSNVRYKNGFIVDSFHGHGIGATANPDYSCSIDRTAGKLRPAFYQDNVKLLIDMNSSTNVRKTGSLLTLDYVQEIAIEQPYASTSEYLNPFNIFNWVGQLAMSPSTDEWRETLRRPQVVIDQTGAYSSYTSDNNSGQTVWNDWQTNWIGTTFENEVSTAGRPVWDAERFGYTTTTNVSQNVRQELTQAREGTRTSYVPSTQYNSQGERTVEMNVVPYIRSRKVYFKATGMKPNTKVYAFFDGISVANYVTEESDFIDYSTRNDANNYLDVTQHPDGYSALTTNSTGSLVGSFVIPNTATLKFKTGQRIFRLTSSEANLRTGVATSAEIVYTASGIQNITQETVIATRTMQAVRTTVTDTRTVINNVPFTDTRTTFTPTLWSKNSALPGGALNPILQRPAVNTTPAAEANINVATAVGGTLNPVSNNTPVSETGFVTNTAGQSTSTVTSTAGVDLAWTGADAKPPTIEITGFLNNNINDPVITTIVQSDTVAQENWSSNKATIQIQSKEA